MAVRGGGPAIQQTLRHVRGVRIAFPELTPGPEVPFDTIL